MKGLSQFIVDVRNSKDSVAHTKRINLELNNIHQKFSTHLSSYQRKKYISKLIYIYLLDNSIDFGLDQALILISSSVYSEKKIGYLFLQLLNSKKKKNNNNNNNNDDELSHHLILDLNNNNEDINCLAIQFISCVGTSNLAIVDLLFGLITSPVSPPLIVKKSCLSLLHILKQNDSLIQENDNWIPRIVTLINHEDLGVVISCLPLIQYIIIITASDVAPIDTIMNSIALKLVDLIINNNCSSDYYYYDTISPWLIVSLFQIIENLFTMGKITIDKVSNSTLSNLRKVVSKSIQNATIPIKGLQNRNSQSSILFQSVSLTIFLEASVDAINGAIDTLLQLLSSQDTNTRYLSLTALIKLNERGGSPAVQTTTHKLETFFKILRDKDISIRKKSLVLISTICDSSTVAHIVSELLTYFPTADYTMRPQISLCISSLVERYSMDSIWYITTMLKLINLNGQHTGIPERIIQIIVNNADLHLVSVKLLVGYIKQSSSSSNININENIIKVASFILGEFGQLYNIDYCDDFINCYFVSDLLTRSMILSCLLKLAIKSPVLKPKVVEFCKVELNSIDLEIQQRSFEYYNILTQNLTSIIQEFPIYPSIKTKSVNISTSQQQATTTTTLTTNWNEGYYRMIQFNAGIFFENSLIKITYRLLKKTHIVQIQFNIFNKSPTLINSLEITPSLPHDTEIPINTKITTVTNINIPKKEKKNFTTTTTIGNLLKISFMCGTLSTIILKLPISILKTLVPAELTPLEWHTRWDQIQTGVPFDISIGHRIVSNSESRLVSRLGFAIITIDDDATIETVMGAGILYDELGKYGVLIRMYSEGWNFKGEVRCTDYDVCEDVVDQLIELFKNGV